MHELGKTIWADDHPELYGEALDFDALANVKSNELLLYDDDATEPFGGVICKLAVYTEHGIMLDTGGEKLTAVDRDELEEEAGIWRMKTDGLPETDGKEPEMKPDENASETVPMLTEKQQAEALHKQIKSYGSIIMQSFYGLCVALKEMRDRGLYKTLGYSEFDYYCKAELGTSDRQVYKYIAIAENLSEEFVNSNSLIGVSKLYLLTTTDEETRTEIVQQNDLTETTVKELREQITQLAADRDKLAADRQREGIRADRLAREAKEKDAQIEECKDYFQMRIRNLEAQIKELETRPVDIAVSEDEAAEIERLRRELAAKKMELVTTEHAAKARADREIAAAKAEMEKQISELKNQQAKPDTMGTFKAYRENAADAVNRLAAFISANSGDKNMPFFLSEFDAILEMMQTRRGKM